MHSSYRDFIRHLKQTLEIHLGVGLVSSVEEETTGILPGAVAWAEVWRQGLQWARSDSYGNHAEHLGPSCTGHGEEVTFQELAQLTDWESHRVNILISSFRSFLPSILLGIFFFFFLVRRDFIQKDYCNLGKGFIALLVGESIMESAPFVRSASFWKVRQKRAFLSWEGVSKARKRVRWGAGLTRQLTRKSFPWGQLERDFSPSHPHARLPLQAS